MDPEQSGKLMARWQAGDQQAAAELFRRYANRLVALARTRLSSKLGRRVDPEDIVQSVYRSFFTAAREGRYDLQRGGDLWRLLVAITVHKVQMCGKRNARQKRSVDREQTFAGEDSLLGIGAEVLAHGPSPVAALALAEELEQLMSRLEPAQRRILELRLQGYQLEEIASQVQCGQRTVRRILERVKELLQQRQAEVPEP
jgi:RNA polymerase sigma-70 factor (ECF subfamily)